MNKLSSEEVNKLLSSLNGWKNESDSLVKEFTFKDFSSALVFLVRIGIEAEKMDHHPELLLHGWNKLKVTLSTHLAGGITENDFKLAKQIDSI